MKHKRITAMIGSLSLVLGCFFNEANCEETTVYAAENAQKEEVTCDGLEAIDLNVQAEAVAPDQETTEPKIEEHVQEEELSSQTSTCEPEHGGSQEPEAATDSEPVTVPAPEPEAAPDPAPESETVVEPVEETETQTETEAETETDPVPGISTVDMNDEDNPDDMDGNVETPEAGIDTGRMEETDAVTKIVTESITEVETELDIGAETETDTDPETEWPSDAAQREVIEDSSPSSVHKRQKDFRFTRIGKRFAIVSPFSDCLIREKMDLSSKAVGKTKREGIVFILEKAGDWYFVESGQVRGFMKEEALYTGDIVDEQVRRNGEAVFDEAVQLCAPGDNEAFTFTHTTVHEVLAEKREGIVTDSTNILEYASPSSKVIGEAKSGTVVYLLATAADGWYFVESGNVRGFLPFDCILSGKSAAFIIADEGDTRTAFAEEVTVPEENRSLYFTVQSVREAQETLPVFNSLNFREAGSDITSYSIEQLQLIWAIVAQEDNGSYEGALAVISSAMNRTESARWGYLGGNALSQLTAPGQYCYSLDHYWQARLGGNVPEYVKQAVYDCLVHGIRNHSYTSFRSTRGKTTGADAVQIGGNWFFGS